jgi:cell division GTPase FtsZ
MSNRVSDNKTTVCPNNHENIEGSKYCHICGLPVIDYTKELDDLINVLSEEEYRVKFSRENVFIGVGDQGCKLVYNFHRTWGSDLHESEFLMIESSGDSQQLIESTSTLLSNQKYLFPRLSLHLIPMSLNKQVGYFSLGERLASEDSNLDDRLLRSGIKATTRKQTIYLVSALGGGTGSGASPFILKRAKSLNPHIRSLVIAMMPAGDEPDSAHFNALSSLSRLIAADQEPLADIILLADYDRLMNIRGVSISGEELAREDLLSHLVAALVGAVTDSSSSEADPGYLAKMSSSMGINVFVPCLAVGRSLEIFGSIGNILESALSSPLAPINRESIMLSYVLVQAPNKLASSLHEKTLRAELNKWNKDHFPNLKDSVLQLSHSNRTSDRVDLCLLLGGTQLAIMAERAKQGFDRFKSIVGRKAWQQEFGVTSKNMLDMQQVINSYDSKLNEMAS